MDIVLIILWMLFIIIGLIGSLVPILPGPPISFLGILFIHRTSAIHFAPWLLWLLWWLTVLTIIMDYTIPQRGTKKFGWTTYGTWWSTLGLLAGLVFFPPLWLIIWPILGAFLGEYLHSNDQKHALRSAWGSFVGFVLWVGIKLIVCGVILWYAIRAIIHM